MDIAMLEFATTHPPRWARPRIPRSALTRREREVLALLSQRLTDREIADTLYISRRTASTHVTNILGKLGAGNRREAGRLGIQLGLR